MAEEGSKYVRESANQLSEETARGGRILGQGLKNTATIAMNEPLKTASAGAAIIGGAAACATGIGCTGGAVAIALGVDQTHALVNGNSMTTSQRLLGDVLSNHRTIEFNDPYGLAGNIVDGVSFASG